jgi:serine/threonine protein kinase
VRILGEGGMGIVYEAEDVRLHRRVALKSLAPRLSSNERLRMRLWQEARAAAALSHPGIATVYALEEIDGQIYIASEYVEGHTLREELDRGPLPIALALSTARDIARALAAAHERGIVHRDMKPENLLRTAGGRIKILDFGLAQFEESARRLVSWTRLTEPGLVAGTPPYMAPEQLLGQATDARTDLFAFGIILYEMVAASHAFGGASLPSTIARILAGDPRPLPNREGVPEGLWPLIVKCLHKDPAQRFASAADLVTLLEALPMLPALSEPASKSSSRNDVTVTAGTDTQDSARWWWQFHQLAAAVLYWIMVWPAWHVHDWMGELGLPFFIVALGSIIVAGNLRLHLWFSSRIYPSELPTLRAQVATWIRWGDYLFAATLLTGGAIIGRGHAGWGPLLIAFAIGSIVAFLVIEPATERAAFGRGGQG